MVISENQSLPKKREEKALRKAASNNKKHAINEKVQPCAKTAKAAKSLKKQSSKEIEESKPVFKKPLWVPGKRMQGSRKPGSVQFEQKLIEDRAMLQEEYAEKSQPGRRMRKDKN